MPLPLLLQLPLLLLPLPLPLPLLLPLLLLLMMMMMIHAVKLAECEQQSVHMVVQQKTSLCNCAHAAVSGEQALHRIS